MDYEWFEPSTVWLTRPSYLGSPVHLAFNEGRTDFDVCWDSRDEPARPAATANEFYSGAAQPGLEARQETGAEPGPGAGTGCSPRGVHQFAVMDWNYYFRDAGSLQKKIIT